MMRKSLSTCQGLGVWFAKVLKDGPFHTRVKCHVPRAPSAHRRMRFHPLVASSQMRIGMRCRLVRRSQQVPLTCWKKCSQTCRVQLTKIICRGRNCPFLEQLEHTAAYPSELPVSNLLYIMRVLLWLAVNRFMMSVIMVRKISLWFAVLSETGPYLFLQPQAVKVLGEMLRQV